MAGVGLKSPVLSWWGGGEVVMNRPSPGDSRVSEIGRGKRRGGRGRREEGKKGRRGSRGSRGKEGGRAKSGESGGSKYRRKSSDSVDGG